MRVCNWIEFQMIQNLPGCHMAETNTNVKDIKSPHQEQIAVIIQSVP